MLTLNLYWRRFLNEQIKDIENWRHAPQHNYEHATTKETLKLIKPVYKTVSQITHGFKFTSVTIKTKVHSSFIRHDSLYQRPNSDFNNNTCSFIAHHWFTKIFWALLSFFKQQHFIIKSCFKTDTTDEQNDVQMENRKLIFKNLDAVQLEYQVHVLRLASAVHNIIQCGRVDTLNPSESCGPLGLIISFIMCNNWLPRQIPNKRTFGPSGKRLIVT